MDSDQPALHFGLLNKLEVFVECLFSAEFSSCQNRSYNLSIA